MRVVVTNEDHCAVLQFYSGSFALDAVAELIRKNKRQWEQFRWFISNGRVYNMGDEVLGEDKARSVLIFNGSEINPPPGFESGAREE